MTFALAVTRPAGTYSLKLLLPMLLVALTAALALSVHPRYVENYLILLDKLYILSYIFVVLTMAVVVRNSWVDATGDVSAATRADHRGLILLTIAYFVAATLMLVLSLP